MPFSGTNPSMEPAETSIAGSNSARTDPSDRRHLTFKREGEVVAVGLRWIGTEYNAAKCWIKCDIDDLIDVDEIE